MFKIDPEFKSLIFPLSDDERRQLEDNLVAEGCRDPLVVWEEKGILLDGHNRKEICDAHGIEYATKAVSIPDRTSAKVWIIKNQTGRRNLSESQRSMLAARLADLVPGGDRGNQHTGGKPPIGGLKQEDAGKLFNVGERSVSRAKAVLKTGSPELIQAVERDQIAVSVAADIATLPKKDQAEVIERGKGAVLATAKELKRKRATARKAKRTAQKAVAVKKNHPLKGKSFRLLLGDILEAGKEIKDESVDSIITDPPYPEKYLDTFAKLAKLAERVLVKGGHCLVMSGQSHLQRVMENLSSVPGLSYQWTLAYLTPGQSTQVFGRKVKSNWKPILWYVKGKNSWEHVEDTVRSDENDKRFHEWGQSVAGMAQLVERFTVEKSLVLDPFVGGGSMAIAALSLNRLFIGIDIDAACVKETADRIARIVL